MPVLSSLDSVPYNVLEDIAFWLVAESFLGPPKFLCNLLLVSRTIWRGLALTNNRNLYARLFHLKFDISAVLRRLGRECGRSSILAKEFKGRWVVLKRMKHREIFSEDDDLLRKDLWTAYLMFMESDGQNARQLIEYAEIDKLAFDFIKPWGRFHDGADNGWVVDNQMNALIAWIFWFTDKKRAISEGVPERTQVLWAFSSVLAGLFKYPCSHAPVTSFRVSPWTLPPPLDPALTFPLFAYPRHLGHKIHDYFGCEVTLACPMLADAALLSCIVRFEASADLAISLLPGFFPATRADAVAMGWRQSKEDYTEHFKIRTLPPDWFEDGKKTSLSHEHDWMRLRACYNPWSVKSPRYPVFTPGMLQGKWVGRCFTLEPGYCTSLDRAVIDGVGIEVFNQFPMAFAQPMEFWLTEHHQHDPQEIFHYDDISSGVGDGIFNAWIPKTATAYWHKDARLELSVPNGKQFNYRTYDAAKAARAALDDQFSREQDLGHFGQGVWDIILTTHTETHFTDVWGGLYFIGRVRDLDGLVVLVSLSLTSQKLQVFRGHVHRERTLIGRWSQVATTVSYPEWEGAWCMTKTKDG